MVLLGSRRERTSHVCTQLLPTQVRRWQATSTVRGVRAALGIAGQAQAKRQREAQRGIGVMRAAVKAQVRKPPHLPHLSQSRVY